MVPSVERDPGRVSRIGVERHLMDMTQRCAKESKLKLSNVSLTPIPGNKHSLGPPTNPSYSSFLTPGLRGKLQRDSTAVRFDPPITMDKLLPAPSVEGDPGRVATLRRYRYLIQFPRSIYLKNKQKQNKTKKNRVTRNIP